MSKNVVLLIMMFIGVNIIGTACGFRSKPVPEAILYHKGKVVGTITLQNALRQVAALKLKSPNQFETLENAALNKAISLAAGQLKPDEVLLRQWGSRLPNNPELRMELATDATYINNLASEAEVSEPPLASEKAFYKVNKSHFEGGPFETVRSRIAQIMMDNERKCNRGNQLLDAGRVMLLRV